MFGKIPNFGRVNSSSAVNVLTNNAEISKMAKNRFFPLNLTKNNETSLKNAILADFSIFNDLLTRSVRKGFQKFNVFFTETPMSFGSRNSEFIEAMGLNFFLKDSKFPVDAKNAIKKGQNFNSSLDIRV